jgi:hypothetical protein
VRSSITRRNGRRCLKPCARGWSSRHNNPVEALALARELTEALNGEQQLWLLAWWEQVRWRQQGLEQDLQRLQRLRQQLLAYVQPRLAWEVALLDLLVVNA